MPNMTIDFTKGFIALVCVVLYLLAYLARLVDNFKKGVLLQAPPLPLPPFLKGPEDLELWDMFLMTYLDFYGLSSYLKDDVREPLIGPGRDDWKKQRARVNYILLNTIADPDVIVTLKLYNWDIKEENPKVTYDLVKRVFAQKTGSVHCGKLFSDFVALRRDQCASMGDYLQRLQSVKDQLTEEGWSFDSDFGVTAVLDGSGLKEDYPALHAKLVEEWTINRLTWEDLIKDLRTINFQERTKDKKRSLV
ncbi:hypothetical protein SMAC4_13318 [Sordaria macrospora]|uniref:uncharacterized protein n=1 Tax=Sordaria macrospora TaxID=5147 RepID=UPI001E066FEB|nr:hypothetical protein B0T09DRAFT_299785 [Sordaria sp. MPI-SDFR-AT-0083]WPJ60929.1 hypothetical protein SMAC4_13318 [Sordaria macrospora]